ncbi:hypothetical protein RND71_034842 [Anisodus tanguticus]|uniref:Uncharacterized protein n=1 Tax=Anisodus tanguticus TaxID=243964 RepID=A0AAE1UZ75_9SOLA|nr:hypothetical protein RND71_034842 [Anisodus tanguticus]
MGISTREEGLLKLVHPGRRVEVHTEPIIAAEVLKKYPRHCIARPDVFKFPWIVVRPEAVLLPGKVFYIVPTKTIYDLLQAKRQQNQQMPPAIPSLNSHDSRDFTSLSISQTSLLRENKCLKNHDNRRLNLQNTNLKGKQFLKNHVNRSISDWSSSFEGSQPMNNAGKLHFAHRNSPLKSTAGMTPKHLRHGKHPSRFKNSPWYYEEDDFKENRNGHDNFSQQSIDDSPFNSTFMHSKRYYYGSSSYSPTSRVVNHHRPYTIRSNQDELKSCLRKTDSERGRLNLKVTFGMTIVTNFFTY